MSVDLAKADEKNASLSMILKADSGYRAKSDGYRVSANQWARIIAVCEEGKQGQVFAAAPALLAAAKLMLCLREDTPMTNAEAYDSMFKSAGSDAWNALRDAIALAGDDA